MTSTTGLLELARHPLWRRWTLASFLARIPNTMTLIALVLVGERVTGSIGVGAQLSGVAIAASGLAAPWRGRRLDRLELRSGLQRDCVVTAGIIAAQAVALIVEAPLPVFFVLAAAQGIAFAAVTGGYRALLVPVVPPMALPRANALEAVFIEVAFVTGPGIASALALMVGPTGVLIAMSASVAAAAYVSRGLPAFHPPALEHTASPLRTPGAWQVYALALVAGVSLGLLESSVPARAVELGRETAEGGFLLMLVAAGSALGGIVAALNRQPLGRARLRGALLLTAMGVMLAPAAIAPSLGFLAVALFASGVPIAPLNALGAMLLQRAVPPSRRTEGFAIFVAAILLGAGLGQSITGQMLDVLGPQGLLWLAAGLPVAAAATLLGPGLTRHWGDPTLAEAHQAQ